MTIEELSDILDLELVIRRYPNQNNRYIASFESVEIKNDKTDGLLLTTYGNGDGPVEAIIDYIQKIRGKWMVVNAGGNNRKEFGIPSGLVIQQGYWEKEEK